MRWSGVKTDTYADANGACLSIAPDSCSVSSTCYADTFDGAMPQVALGLGFM